MRFPIFSIGTIKKHYEVAPLVTIVAAHVIGCFYYGAYMLNSRPDVRIVKSGEERFKRIDMDKPQTLRLFQKKEYKHEYPQEMDDLRKEIWADYRKNQQ